MFKSFSEGKKEQIKGMINFIENNSGMLKALQNKNYKEFIKLYNGPEQVSDYLKN